MSYRERYEQWLNDDFFDETTRRELKSLTDEKELKIDFIAIWNSVLAVCVV